MADDITVTPGSGATIAADDVGGKLHQRIKIVAGADGAAADCGTFKVDATFNRPTNTTPYSVNDAVNDNTTAGSVTELSWTIPAAQAFITRVRVKKGDAGDSPTIRVWLYDAAFATGAGDNAAFVHPVADCIGYVDVIVSLDGSDDAVGFADCQIPVTVGTLYGELQTLTAFAPGSGETFTVSLWGIAG